MRKGSAGFTLTELLLVLAILGIIGAIAIPSLLGVKEQARLDGEVKTALAQMSMALEMNKLKTGQSMYPVEGAYTWDTRNDPPIAASPILNFDLTIPKTRPIVMVLTVAPGRQSYTISVTDPKNAKLMAQVDQNGKSLLP